jgi:hypothetical protein
MWETFRTEEIVGDQSIVNVTKLVDDFLHGRNCEDIELRSPEALKQFLTNKVEPKRKKKNYNPGVYGLYKDKVHHVGQSRDLRTRITEQFIGREKRKWGLPNFTRLYYAFLKKEHNSMTEKRYVEIIEKEHDLALAQKLIDSYRKFVFESGNRLRVYFARNDLESYVLEQILIKYFRSKGECVYDRQHIE